jgi:lipopolysaccharide export system permease protein
MKTKYYKIIDFYISRKFLGTFIYSIVLIISIAIIFDMAENLDEFISKDIPTKDIIFRYYMNFVPYFANLFSPLFTFISVIYFTSKMAYNTEIIAILSNGMSYQRLMRPYLVSAAVIATFSYLLGNYVIPSANRERIDFKNQYINQKTYQAERNIHRQIEPGVFIYMQQFTNNNIGLQFTLEKFENQKLVEKITANSISWNQDSSRWVINNYWKRTFVDGKEYITTGYQIDTVLNTTPSDYKVELDEMEALTTKQLRSEIKSMNLRGVNSVEFAIERHKRISGPFSAFILTIIGVSLASRKIKGGLGFHLGLGLLLSFSYILFMQVSVVFAVNGNTPPFLAVWIPNFMYAVIAFFLFRWAAK